MQLLISDAATLPSLLEAVDKLDSLLSDTAIPEAQRIRSGLLEVHKSLCKWNVFMRQMRPVLGFQT